MEIKIRKACEKDLSMMLEVQRKAFEVQAKLYDAWDIPPMTEGVLDVDLDMEGLTVLIAEIDGELAGSIRLLAKGRDAEVKRLSVSDIHQNKGLGRMLLEEIECVADSGTRLWLFTGGQSEKNISLYQKMGYRVFKEEPFKDGFTLVYMEKHI